MKAVVFIDRDGTIIREPRDRQIDSLEKLEFIPGIIAGLRLLRQSGLTLVMVSNQDGLGTSKYPKRSFDLVQKKLLTTLGGEGVEFERICICPHRPADQCPCRKPKTSLLTPWLRHNPIRAEASFVLGDRGTDVQFAENLGIRAVRLLSSGKRATKKTPQAPGKPRAFFQTTNALEACEMIVRSSRRSRSQRTTSETEVLCDVSLTGQGFADIETGIGFFDHMLTQIARHSGIDIELKVRGDLDVDEHHTVEDTAIVLGESLRKALGNKAGIRRYGFVLPMDEAKAEALIDLSGRASLRFEAEFHREYIGRFPTEMVEHFFRSFAESLGASLHIRCSGRNEHHKIEAIFKAVACALRQAVELKMDRLTIPSSKGAL